jgi:hypothetical protein
VTFQIEVVVSVLRADFEPQARRYRKARWNRVKRETRGERSNEIGASASGILLNEQSTPRHKDLEAGIWMRAVRRARQFITHRV